MVILRLGILYTLYITRRKHRARFTFAHTLGARANYERFYERAACHIKSYTLRATSRFFRFISSLFALTRTTAAEAAAAVVAVQHQL